MTIYKLEYPQRAVLQSLVRPTVFGLFQDTPNVDLNDYIYKLQHQYPEAFHFDEDSKRQRVFVDEPKTLIPHAKFLRKLIR